MISEEDFHPYFTPRWFPVACPLSENSFIIMGGEKSGGRKNYLADAFVLDTDTF